MKILQYSMKDLKRTLDAFKLLNVPTKNEEAFARINTKLKERKLDGKTAEARNNFRRISKLIKKEV